MGNETALLGELSRKEVRINFQPQDPMFAMHTAEYGACWQVEGQRIANAFQQVTNLPFAENELTAIVGLGDKKGRSNSGHKQSDSMLLKFNSSDKLGNLIHELTHRFIMQHSLWRLNRDRLGLTEVHQMLDLIYFEVLTKLYGESAAMKRVEHEKKIDDPKYREAWEWTLAKTPEEKAALLKEVTDVSRNHV